MSYYPQWDKDINKLDYQSSNIEQWKFYVMTVLKAEDLDGYVDGTENKPDPTRCSDWRKWKKGTSKAMLILLASISKLHHSDLVHCKDAREMWNLLVNSRK